jgi:hypothetical protein
MVPLIPPVKSSLQRWTLKYGTLTLLLWQLVLPLRSSYRTLITFHASLSTPSLLPVCWGYNIITDLLHKGLLRPSHSPCNSPILAVKKPNGTYHLVQDLRLINNAVKPIHPLVPNPYTILSSIPASSTHFSVLDLKDAFFTIVLCPESQDIFAFTWTDPHTHHSQQLTWTVLPQGFRDSPHLFGQALAKDLRDSTSLGLPSSNM